jgi:hypothetical protein
MARRNQDKIKHFRGAKQQRKDATASFMAGELKPSSAGKKPAYKMSAVLQKSTVVDLNDGIDDAYDDNNSAGYTMQQNDSEDDDEDEEADDDDEDKDEDIEENNGASDNKTGMAETNNDAQDGDDIIQEDDETQLITPPKNHKRAKHNRDEAPPTIAQYKAMVHNLQVQLRNAEQQIRAISKGSLVDKFMAAQVKKYVKESLWKRCKFITCRETMEECMEEVAHHFGIRGEKREHWKSTYEHAVRDALNNRRNNTAQGLKKELIGTCRVCGRQSGSLALLAVSHLIS